MQGPEKARARGASVCPPPLLAQGTGRAGARSLRGTGGCWPAGRERRHSGSLLLMVFAHRSSWLGRAHLILDFPPDFLQRLLL